MKKLLTIITILSLIVSGCKKEEDVKPVEPAPVTTTPTTPTVVYKADFIITNEVWSWTTYNKLQVTTTVKNTGNGSGYNVSVKYRLKDGSTIVDNATSYPGNLDDILPGESAVDDAIFFNTTPESYELVDTYTTEIDWIDN